MGRQREPLTSSILLSRADPHISNTKKEYYDWNISACRIPINPISKKLNPRKGKH
jgi:hypothetical protein